MDGQLKPNVDIRRYSKSKIVLFFISLVITIISFLITSGAINQVIGFFFLLSLGVLFVRPLNQPLFFSFFFISILFSRLLVFEFLMKNGTYFIGGGDDELFNDLSHDLAANQLNTEDPVFLAMPYKLYLYLLAFWIKIVSFFDTNNGSSNFHYSLLMLNSFFGSLVVINIKNILEKVGILSYLTLLQKFFIFFNPYVIYFSSVLLREIALVYFITAALLSLFATGNKLKNLLVILICFVSAFLIRPASSLLILTMLFTFVYFKINSILLRVILIVTLSSIIVFYILPSLDALLGRDIAIAQTKVLELVTDQSAVNSLGSKLIQSNNIFSKIIVPFYILMSPLPPPIFNEITIRALIISLGSLFWFITIIIYTPILYSHIFNLNIRKIINSKYSLFVLVTASILIFNSLIVGYGSLDPRHHLVLYPIIMPVAIAGFTLSELHRYKNYYIGIFIMIIILFVFYIAIKISI